MTGCDRRDHFENRPNEAHCGTCIYHRYESASQGWACVNDKSEYLGDWTEYDGYCEEWKERG